MESLINESVNLILKKIGSNLFITYMIIFLISLNIYNCIRITNIIYKISNIIKQQTEVNNRISMIKNDRNEFIKSIVIKCIQEHNNISDKNYLTLIEKQNKEIKILRKRIIMINEKLNNNNII